jgi:hypothetical protein
MSIPTARFSRLAVILLLAGLRMSAATIFASTFSALNPSYDPSSGDAWAVGSSGQTELAVGFQNSFAGLYMLGQIQIADNFSIADPNASTNPALNNLNVGIWQSATNDINSAVEVQSWTIVAPGSAGSPAQIFTLNSAFATVIDPANFYFITESVTPDGANTAEWGWQENNLTPFQIGYFGGTFGAPGSWSLQNTPCANTPCSAATDPAASGTPAFSASGNQVTTPEPNTIAMLGAAFVGLLLRKRS